MNMSNNGNGNGLLDEDYVQMKNFFTNGGVLHVQLINPIPVLSRKYARENERVIDSIVDWVRVAQCTGTLESPEYEFYYNHRRYPTGSVEEDGLWMPCIWVD